MRDRTFYEQGHERVLCAFTHFRVALCFAAFSAWEVFLRWRNLDRPPPLLGSADAVFYILAAVLGTLVFMQAFRCFSERFVFGISFTGLAMAAASRFLPSINSRAGLTGRFFLALWVVALLLSANMAIQALRHPYIGPPKPFITKRGILIISGIVVSMVLLSMLLYWFVPSP